MFGQNGTAMTILILLMLICIIVLAVITISLSMRVSRMQLKYKQFMRGNDGATMEDAILDRFEEIDKLSDQGANHHEDIKLIKAHLSKTLTHYGVVKYDAFDDVGGKMSFALAMLDSDNSGFILDTIHSKDNCFVYLKEIVKGESYIMLSSEEIEALKQAASDLEAADASL